MALTWQFLGKQELWDSGVRGKGYAYIMLLWRTPVPGGWMLMTLNSKSNNPDPVLSFYPDPTHSWSGTTDPASEYLLRPAEGNVPTSSEQLLRAADEESQAGI